MVLDQLAHAEVYGGLSPILRRALRYLATTDWESSATGRRAFEGDDIFALVSDYDTRPAETVPWEAHRRYIDVQYVHRGTERIGHAPIATLTCGEYDGARDLVSAEGHGAFITLTAGMFAIFWPHDVHRPGIAVDRPVAVRKVVFKVAVQPASYNPPSS